MADKLEVGVHSVVQKNAPSTDLSGALFGEYIVQYRGERKAIKEKTHSELDRFVGTMYTEPLKKDERIEELKYDPLKLSIIAKNFLEKNQDKIIRENPESSCIVIYRQGQNGERSQATRLCIPRLNPGDKVIHVDGFTLKPLPKSNGYNTEYEIKDAKGNDWSQLAVLFPAENPKYKRKENLTLSIHESTQKINLLEKQLHETKKNPVQLKKLHGELLALRQKVSTAKGELEQYTGVRQYTHFSYIPYREGLNTNETRNQGFHYLAPMMQQAYAQKFQNQSLGNTESSIRGKTISEILPWQYPLILNLVERMDFWLYFDRKIENIQSKDAIKPIMKAQLEKSLTTFGANTSAAFNYQRSRVGAQGIGQIMPDTYQSFHNPRPTNTNPSPDKKYMPFFPESDFDAASRDHATSFRLQIAHLDSQIFQFPKGIRENWDILMKDESTSIGIISLLAGGYNGSMRRIMDEVFGDILQNPPSDRVALLNLYKKRLNPENIVKYMEKAKDADIQEILAKYKIRPHLDKKTGQQIQGIIPAGVQNLIDRRNSTYKESMTYVLKAEYVWKYLKSNYPGKF